MISPLQNEIEMHALADPLKERGQSTRVARHSAGLQPSSILMRE